MPHFLLNDTSLHGQFTSCEDVIAPLKRVYEIRQELQKNGFKLGIHSRVSARPATAEYDLRNALFRANRRDITALILTWFDKDGPFWDNPPRHDPNECFECNNDLVASSALAEAAILVLEEGRPEADIVSFRPSRFEQDPLSVLWRGRPDGDVSVSVRNHVSAETLPIRFHELERPVQSWTELLQRLHQKCPNLLFSPHILGQVGTSFEPNVAERCLVLLPLLDQMVFAARERNYWCSVFMPRNITNLGALVEKLRNRAGDLCNWLGDNLGEETRDLLAQGGNGDANLTLLRTALANDLGRVVRGGPIYTAQRFPRLQPETRRLATGRIEGTELLRLNIRLLEESFPDEITRRGDDQQFFQLQSLLMVGDRARFTDSSDTEKKDRQFAQAMTFTHPETRGRVFCSWHGKIQTPLYRIHFEWPIPDNQDRKILVAYIGPKLTKK
jgi:hypothetical protein